MGERAPWGRESRRCARCGKVGPRVYDPRGFGYIHTYCRTEEEARDTKRANHRPHPDDFEVACQADEAIRRNLPGVRQPAYIHDSLKPLREIDFAAEVERKRGSLFGRHSGMCGSECFS